MSERDPFQLLRDLNPTAALEQTSPSDDALLASILATPVVAPRSRRRWWWMGLSACLITVGATAYAVLRSAPAKNPILVSCYSNAAAEPLEQEGLGAVADPIAACQDRWKAGVFGDVEVPQLTGCVTRNDIVAVIPGDSDVCERLGLDLWNGVIDDEAKRVIAFTDEFTEAIRHTCYPEADANRIAQELLDKHGLDGWHIASNDNWSDERPCTLPGFDPPIKTVTIGARARRPDDKDPPG